MFDKIFRLGKEAVIYGLSSIVGRFINFLLVPFYTNYLTKSENGISANVYAFVTFAFIIYSYGMESAYMRHVATLELGDKKQNFSTPFFSLIVSSICFSLLISFFAVPIAEWEFVNVGAARAPLIQYAGWILFFDTLTVIPFASLRMSNRAKVFAGLRILHILFNVGFNILFIVPLKMRTAEAIFLANLLASALIFLVLLHYTLPQLTFRLPKGLYRELIRFGLPYIPAGLAGVAIQVVDKPILMHITQNADLVGLYQINYRLGVIMLLFVGMFDYAWRPFFLTHAKDENAKELFSKIFSYFMISLSTILVIVSLFIDDLVRLHIGTTYFIAPAYWEGLTIVPLILLSYVFLGAYISFIVGVILEKRTSFIPYVTGAGGAVSIALNYLLIPIFGIMGSAMAAVLGQLVMAIGIYYASQRFYYIPYEWNKMVRLALITTAILGGFYLILPSMIGWQVWSLKGAMVLGFVCMIVLLKVITPTEFSKSKSLLLTMIQRKPAPSKNG
ncbi:MAG: oligosaccharide flippase family protein [bacterium]